VYSLSKNLFYSQIKTNTTKLVYRSVDAS